MAPEQITGEPLDGRADVYSFGCMVYRCLTGELPFRRPSRTATLMAHANASVPLPSAKVAGLPTPLDVVVRRAMEKDPARRAPSAGALMRWADEQIRAGHSAAHAVTTDSPTEEVVPREPRRPRPGPPAAAPVTPPRKRLPLAAASALTVLGYAPLWAAGFLLGSHL
jgi:serine/threonine-protein kinase